MSEHLRTAAVVALALFAAGCPRQADMDAGDVRGADRVTRGDGAPEIYVRPDMDGDGLCDETELSLRTSLTSPDTDGDGLGDLFEYEAYTSPLSATDPPPTERLQVRERPGATATLGYDFLYRGMGESLLGVPLDRVSGVDGRAPSELGLAVAARWAEPRSLVEDISGSSITGIGGIVRTGWELSVTWPAIAPIRCRRAYLAYASAYALGRGLVFARGIVIDVLADDADDVDGGGGGAGGGGGGGVEGGADGGFDAAEIDGESGLADGSAPTGPRWPHVVDGFCAPEPGACR